MNRNRSLAGSLASAALRRLALSAAASMRAGSLVATLPDGALHRFGQPGAEPAATLRVHDDEFFRRMLFHGEIGFGEAFVDGLWDTDDLVTLVQWAIANRAQVPPLLQRLAVASRFANRRLHLRHRNSRGGARDNIHAHYDLGNDFFGLFLDETMTYSCGYFTSADEPLADAQRRKYRMLCEKAEIGAAHDVLEIGCGWGGFAMFAAENYGCHVTSITISRDQLALARERIESAGLSRLIDVRFCDYRDIAGQYDRVVSIEMFEAVGAEYFEAFFHACDRALRPGGRMAMQSITVPDRSFASLRDGVNWMQKYIFPGGMLPSISEIERALRPTSLMVTAFEDIGPHYAVTLRRWREGFLAHLDEVRALGFDERFIRIWEYYLAVSEAGFLSRNTGDVQIIFDKPGPPAPTRTAAPAQFPATA